LETRSIAGTATPVPAQLPPSPVLPLLLPLPPLVPPLLPPPLLPPLLPPLVPPLVVPPLLVPLLPPLVPPLVPLLAPLLLPLPVLLPLVPPLLPPGPSEPESPQAAGPMANVDATASKERRRFRMRGPSKGDVSWSAGNGQVARPAIQLQGRRSLPTAHLPRGRVAAMKRSSALVLGCLVALLLTGCTAAVGVAGSISVPQDSPAQCTKICSDMGTTLSAVVVMANNVGCVCNPPNTQASTAPPPSPPASNPPASTSAPATNAPPSSRSASVAGGMAAIVMQEQAQRQQSHASGR
jgi:hypothetical protein